MPQEWLIRGPRPVTFDDIVAATAQVAPDERLRADRAGRWVLIVDATDAPALWIGVSQQVHAPGPEARRLRLPDSDHRWWTTIARPLPVDARYAQIGQSVAESLAELTGGRAAPWQVTPQPNPAVLPALPTSDDEWPADRLTSHEVYSFSSRPVISADTWLHEHVERARRSALRAVVVTQRHTHATPAAHDLMRRSGTLWAVDTGKGLADGATGLLLETDREGRLTTTGAAYDAENPTDSAAHDALHAVTETFGAYADAAVGMSTRDIARGLNGLARPHHESDRGDDGDAMGEIEPFGVPFSCESLTEHAARMSPGASQVHATLGATAATITVTPQPTGIVERAEIFTAARTDLLSPTREHVLEWAEALHREGVTYAVLSARTVSAEGNLLPTRDVAAPLMLMLDARRFPRLSPLDLTRNGALHVDGDLLVLFFDEDQTTARAQHARACVTLLAHDTWATSA